MAVIQDISPQNQNELDQQKKDAAQQSSSAPTSGGTMPGGGVNRPHAGSGQFQDIRKFIDQNKPGAERLEQGVVGNIGQQAGSIREGIQASQGAFGQTIDPTKQRQAGGEDFINQAIQKASQGQGPSSEDSQRFGQLRSGYSENLSTDQNLQGLQTRGSGLANLAGGVNSEQGRFGLLQNVLKSPTYSAGQQRLDQLLLGSTPGLGQRFIKDIGGAASGIGTAAQQEQASQQGQIGSLNARTQALQGMATGALVAELGSEQNAFNTATAQRQAGRSAQLQQVQTDLQAALNSGDTAKANSLIQQYGGGSGMDVDSLNALKAYTDPTALKQYTESGLSDYEKQVFNDTGAQQKLLDSYKAMGTNPLKAADILKTGTAATAGQLATPEDRARYQAMSQLVDKGMLEKYSDLGALSGQAQAAPTIGAYSASAVQDPIKALSGQYDKFKATTQQVAGDTKQQAMQNQSVLDMMSGKIPIDPEAIKAAYPHMNEYWVRDAVEIVRGTKKPGYQKLQDQMNTQNQATLQQAAGEFKNNPELQGMGRDAAISALSQKYGMLDNNALLNAYNMAFGG